MSVGAVQARSAGSSDLVAWQCKQGRWLPDKWAVWHSEGGHCG
jgi:hypothetical protein